MAKWYQPSETRDAPWICADAIDYLDSILAPDMTVCEFGGGGSTLWIALRCKTIITYERDPKWREFIEAHAPDNVTVVPSGMWASAVPCDLLFIDGEPVEWRADWLREARHIARKWIVLDNANRPEYAKERDALAEFAKLVHTSNGNEGGTKYLVTEFWRCE